MKATLWTGGTIITSDKNRRRVNSVLVRNGKIAQVDVQGLPTDAVVIDLQGRTMTPGFNDSHIHTMNTGEVAKMLSLAGLSKPEVLEALVAHSAELPKGELLYAGNWDYTSCPDPNISDLDAILPDRPAFLMQFSGHGAWANSAFMAQMKYNVDTPDWSPGGLEKDSNGELTGIIREPGRAPGIRKVYMKRLRNKKLAVENLAEAQKIFLEYGITSVQDNTWFPWHLNVIRAAKRAGNLTVRMSCWSPGFMRPLDIWFSHKRFDNDWFHRGPKKHFLDGAFSAHTAYLSEPYTDQPDTTGGAAMSADGLEKVLSRAAKNGRQVACHSIGDEATRFYLDAVQSVTSRYPDTPELRHRIEHGQLMHTEDISRIADLGMVVAGQPHAAADPDKDIALIGEERMARAYPFRSLLDAGVKLAFGSDYPSEATLEPVFGIYLAATMTNGQAITPEEAIEAYTAGSAYAEFKEHEKGMIKEGYVADFAILSADPTSLPVGGIKEISVDATVVDGELVYDRSGVFTRTNQKAI